MKCLISSAVVLIAASFVATGAEKNMENIALGKSYTLWPEPNYPLCTDEGDVTDLTDGVRIEDETVSFWGNKGCVGWQHVRDGVEIVIDLERVEPIRGVAFHSAAGGSGVTWPSEIELAVSEDGKTFHVIGDMIRMMDGPLPPPYGEYALEDFRTTALETKGRYVRFRILPSGLFVFVDEIEIFRGDKRWLEVPYPEADIAAEAVSEELRLTRSGAYNRIRRDWESVQKTLSENPVFLGGPALKAGMDALRSELEGSVFPEELEGFRAVVPLNELHRRIFAVHGKILAAQLGEGIVLWESDPYELLGPFEPPRKESFELDIAMMNGERRSRVFNLTNLTDGDRTVSFTIEDLPGGTNPEFVKPSLVEAVDTREQRVVAAALIPMTPADGRYEVEIPSGMTRQIWLGFEPADLEPGPHQGSIALRGDLETGIPLVVEIAATRFPDQPTLNTGLWDYISDRAYQITEANSTEAIAIMNSLGINNPWCAPGSVPLPDAESFDQEGNLIQPLDFTKWDAFVDMWPEAELYMAFANLPSTPRFAGFTPPSEEFDRAVSQWAQAWAYHNKERGVAGRVALLIIDEPGRPELLEAALAYTRPFREGTREILLFNDPAAKVAATDAGRELLELSDIVCPTRGHYQALPPELQEYYRSLPGRGIALWLYMCNGPTRLFDPGYFRYQPWHGFKIGATGSAFWAFGDAGGADNWNEYPAVGRASYTPVYLAPDSVTPAKHSEALREGIADYEYLVMLRDRIAALEERGETDPRVASARALLESLPETVEQQLEQAFGNHYGGRHDNSSRFAEKARVQILRALDELQGL